MSVKDRRGAIVEAVVPLLVEHGPQVSTRQIAEAAGIAEGTIFRVFDDKAALWQAAAEHILDPDVELAELHRALDGVVDLPAKIERAAEHLYGRSQKVMAVMMAMRSIWMSGSKHDHRPGEPPAFIVEANRALMRGLTDLFEPHRAELSVPPATAATVLRTLVLGARHPGSAVESQLPPLVIAEVMLGGIRRPRRSR